MSDTNVEKLILQNLINNPEFTGKVINYLKDDYFAEKTDQAVFDVINTYFKKANKPPEHNVMLIEIDERDLNEVELEEAKGLIDELCTGEIIEDLPWLVDQAEHWCKERSMYLAIMKAISIYDGSDKALSPHIIPDLLKEALAVSFETKIGHDWSTDSEERFDRYNYEEHKIPFDLETFNDITNGGVSKKTLNLILAGVHVGKSMSLVHLAAGYARKGFNVLYLSMEMDEFEVLHRIDANILKTSMHSLRNLGKDKFMNRVEKIRQKSYGDIKVVQYPTSIAHSGHFNLTINELEAKLNWKPDIVIVDYIGIVASARVKVGSTNSHFYLKSVAEELRAMAIEKDLVVWSAMQLTRAGMGSNDVEMTDVAESIGIPGVCDFMYAVIRTPEMDEIGQLTCKQLKNRYRNMVYRPKFVIGVDLEKQLFSDVAGSEQTLTEEVHRVDSTEVQKKFESSFKSKVKSNFNNIDMSE